MKLSMRVFVGVLIATTVFWLVAIGVHKRRAPDVARSKLKAVIPAYAAKIEKSIKTLKGETSSESASNLSFVTDYFNPGPVVPGLAKIESAIPLDLSADRMTLDAIISNRRFRKLLGELSEANRAVAAQTVRVNLMSAITDYLHLFESDMREQAARHTVSPVTTHSMGPVFVTGIMPGGDESKKVLLGERFKILTLVLISGMLKLTENREEIEQVVRLAIKQRTELYEDSTLTPYFRGQMLAMASLYNRQVLGCAMIGVTTKGAVVEANAMKSAGVHWVERTLTAYDATLTEFDKPAVSGGLTPDYSVGSIPVKLVSPMSDAGFDLLLKELNFKP